jgi:hypothetical protein
MNHVPADVCRATMTTERDESLNSGSRWATKAELRLPHEPFSLAPPNEIVLSKEGGLFGRAYVIANLLLPWVQSFRSGLTQVLVELRCQIPKHSWRKPLLHERHL